MRSCRAIRPRRSRCRSRPSWCTRGSAPNPSATSSARCPPAGRVTRTREWCCAHSDGRGERPGRLAWSSQCRHARASLSRRARRRRGRRSTDCGGRTGRAGSPCPWARRTRIPSPRPAMASADARRPARHGRGSTPSPSRAVADAQPPTPAVTRFWSDSFRSLPFRVPSLLLSFCFPLIWFVFFFLQNLLIIKAVSPPLDVTPAAIKAAFVRQTGHIGLVLSFLAGSLMRLLQILGQAIKRSFPKLAIFFHPLRGLFQRLGFQLHFVHAPIAATPEQPCFFQHAQM